MKVLQIASGSSGNATVFFSNSSVVILDCGISKKRIVDELNKYNYSLSDVDAIFITHEHIDHTSGLIPLQNATSCPIYLTKGTYDGLKKNIKEKVIESRYNFITNHDEIIIKDMTVSSLAISHDAIDPVGYIFIANDTKAVYVTDTGYVDESNFEILSNADIYLFESNHDPAILMSSDRPYETKMRIIGDYGHLSNEDSAYILSRIIGVKTKAVIYSHISEECNLKEVVRLTHAKVYNDLGLDVSNIKFYYGSRNPLEVIEI